MISHSTNHTNPHCKRLPRITVCIVSSQTFQIISKTFLFFCFRSGFSQMNIYFFSPTIFFIKFVGCYRSPMEVPDKNSPPLTPVYLPPSHSQPLDIHPIGTRQHPAKVMPERNGFQARAARGLPHPSHSPRARWKAAGRASLEWWGGGQPRSSSA